MYTTYAFEQNLYSQRQTELHQIVALMCAETSFKMDCLVPLDIYAQRYQRKQCAMWLLSGQHKLVKTDTNSRNSVNHLYQYASIDTQIAHQTAQYKLINCNLDYCIYLTVR